jgi:zinc finger SWIM domain-containing protein 3
MHFERTVEVKRTKELQSEFNERKYIPRIKMFTPMLVEASKVYTSIIFEAFQGEYERSTAACCRVLDGNNRFAVAIGSIQDKEGRKVVENPKLEAQLGFVSSISQCGT